MVLSSIFLLYKKVKLTRVALVSRGNNYYNSTSTHNNVEWVVVLKLMTVSLHFVVKLWDSWPLIFMCSLSQIMKFFTASSKNVVKVICESNCCLINNDDVLCSSEFELQSGESSFADEGEVLDVTKQVTTEFLDESKESDDGFSAIGNWYQPTKTADSDIVDFMSRPVLIHSVDWVVGGLLDESINPWGLYFNTDTIRKKLDNYAFLRCDLKIKVLINASPFYYGALLASYQPQAGLAATPVNTAALEDVAYSQMPHFWIYPQTSTGGEMTLPFLSITEWLHTVGASGLTELNNMGKFRLDSIGTLKFANATGAADINIQVYAWAENVELAGLTVDVALQMGKDEYSSGPVSKVASAIARGSSKLESVPFIGKYMTATTVASSAVANIASLFGYTKVPNLKNIEPVKDLPFHGLATSDQPDVTEKLTVDSKNELCIDSSVLGTEVGDPLMISSIAQRSSYLTSFTWAASDAEGTLLWNSFVTPCMGALTSGTSQDYWQGTPMWILNEMFTYWRGDIIFDIKVICSGYHRGRVIFAWDPSGDIANTTNSTSTCFNKIVDISEESEFSLRIPYIQATPYQKTPTSIEQYYGTSALASDAYGGTTNGILTARVLNKQTSPVASASVTLIVSVRGADNLEFAAPKKINTNINFYAVQSGETTMGEPSTLDPNVNLVYMGEKVSSVRELLQRCNLSMSYPVGEVLTDPRCESSYINRRPLYRGFDPNGIHSATAPVAAANAPFNYVTTTPYHLITSCFLGERGSITWKVNLDGVDYRSVDAGRSNQILTAAKYDPIASANVYDIDNLNTLNLERSERNTYTAGAALVNQMTNTGLSVNVPMYSIYTMLDTAPADRTLGDSTVATTTDTLRFSWVRHGNVATGTSGVVDYLFQTGPDHSLVQFICVPTVYLYTTPAVAT